MKKTQKVIELIIVSVLIVACGDITSTQMVMTPNPIHATVASTSAPAPIVILTLNPTSTPTDVPSVIKNLLMAYQIDGNLFLQKGSDPPLQLTNGGMDIYPTFSDDGMKFVFLRGLVPRDLYSVNLDGSGEQQSISGNILASISKDYSEYSELSSFAFVPDTHLIVFNTRQLGEEDIKNQDWQRISAKETNDLFLLDLDSGEITQLLPPGKGGDFAVSPNGKLIAVWSNGHIDIVDINGQTIYRNLVTYKLTHPYELSPKVFWNENSAEIVVILPDRDVYDLSGPETLLVRRYSLDGSENVQVTFNPPVLEGDIGVSPDGYWILYNYFYYPGKTDEIITSGLYLGNLRDGHTEIYAQGTISPTWNPDSKHFVYDGSFLGNVDGMPFFIGTGHFLGWIDANHYLYFDLETGNISSYLTL